MISVCAMALDRDGCTQECNYSSYSVSVSTSYNGKSNICDIIVQCLLKSE
jgi:hypothetical protein